MSIFHEFIVRLITSIIVLTGGSLHGGVAQERLGAPLTALKAPVVIRRVETSRPYVAITVDDFYTGDFRRQVAIDILKSANAEHATLTLCPAGSALVDYSNKQPAQAAELKQLFDAGSYELCDHTYSHPIMPRLGAVRNEAAEVGEIVRGQQAIDNFFGRNPLPIFRPPFGSWDLHTERASFEAGYPRLLLWSIDSGDSEGPEKPARQLLTDVQCAGPGDIILMHANRTSSAEAMPLIIKMLRAKGLELVGISELLASGTPDYSYNPSDMRRLYTCKR